MERPHPDPALLPCGCHGECDCPPYVLAGATFFAGVAVVLMSPVLLAVPGRRPAEAEVLWVARVGLEVFLVLAVLQFAFTVVAILAAVLTDRDRAAVRIWTAGKAVVAMGLGSGGGVGAVLLLWGVLSLA
jgi:hypothetical protein